MKHIIFILTIILLCGCRQKNGIDYVVKPKPSTVKQKEVKQVTSNYNTTYNVVEVDGCEYIVKHNPIRESGGSKRDIISITHKGNCKYCLERNK